MHLVAIATTCCAAHFRASAQHDTREALTGVGTSATSDADLRGTPAGSIRGAGAERDSEPTSYVDEFGGSRNESSAWPAVRSPRASGSSGAGPLPSQAAARLLPVLEDPQRFDPIGGTRQVAQVAQVATPVATLGAPSPSASNASTPMADNGFSVSPAQPELHYTVNTTMGPTLSGLLYEFFWNDGTPYLLGYKRVRDAMYNCEVRDRLVARLKEKNETKGQIFGEDRTWTNCAFASDNPIVLPLKMLGLALITCLCIAFILLLYYKVVQPFMRRLGLRSNYGDWKYYGAERVNDKMTVPQYYFGRAPSFEWRDIISLPSDPGSGFGDCSDDGSDGDGDGDFPRKGGPFPPHYMR